jgi:leader peptidase (prepilin peptidase)/N-methyltransferase
MDYLLDALTHHTALYYITAVAVGLMVGSFLNVVAHRLPIMMEREWRIHCAELTGTARPPDSQHYDLCRPRSRCPQCQRPIRVRENIPVLSYVMQAGRCVGCGWHIPLRYPIIELLGAAVAVVAAARYGVSVAALGAACMGWALLALSAIDLDHHLLPDTIALPLLWAGLGLNLIGTYTTLQASVLGAMAGYLLLWAVYWTFKLLTGKEGMGYGDFKLLAALGAWTGWQQLPLIILLASAVGATVGVALIAAGQRQRSQPIPFGPFLAASGWVALLWGPMLSGLYLRFAAIG